MHGARATNELETKGTAHINFGYFFQLLAVSCLGIMQFGLSISAWNIQSNCFKLLIEKRNGGYDQPNMDYIQWMATGGMVAGSFAAGPMSAKGKWFGVIAMGVVSLLGGGASLVYSNYYAVLVGKFLTGFAAGGYNVFCPKYIMECAPKEISGPAGAAFQLAVTFGIFINAIIALPAGDLTPENDEDFLVKLYFIIQIIPMAMAVLQILLMFTCYRSDTPVVMCQQGQEEKLAEFFTKMYNDDAIREDRLSELRQQVSGGGDDEGNTVSYGQALCGPQYKLASFVAISLAAFQQLTGINVVMFYSSKIFAPDDSNVKSDFSVVQINFWVYFVNFVSVFGAIILLSRVGRRTIMLVCNLGEAAMLILLGYFLIQRNNNACFVCTLVFLVLFEFSSGPVVWLYIAEISTDKAASVATVINQAFNLSMAIIPTIISDNYGKDGIAEMFMALGGCTVLGTIYIFCFMKETRGKSPAEIEEMFASGGAERAGYH